MAMPMRPRWIWAAADLAVGGLAVAAALLGAGCGAEARAGAAVDVVLVAPPDPALAAVAASFDAAGYQTAIAGVAETAVAEADVLVPTVTDRLSADVIAAAGDRLKLIANYGNGVDNIDLPAAREKGITVTNTPGVLTDIAFRLLSYYAFPWHRKRPS